MFNTPVDSSDYNKIQFNLSLKNVILIIGIVLVVGVMGIKGCQGMYTVKPGESAALQTFGAARSEPVVDEGWHWHWPPPIGKTTVLQTQKSRTAEIGFRILSGDDIDPSTGENWQRDLDSATMITGDLNLVETQLVAHYFISDLNKYLFNADDPGLDYDSKNHPIGYPDGRTIQDALEIAVRRSIGQRTIDQTLVGDREVIEFETMQQAQDILNEYETGLTITSVQLQEIKPPDQVQEAFDDVLRAREQKDTRINEALAFESRTLPEARGMAEKLRKESEAYRADKIARATGEADRFLNILKEYQVAPDIIRTRIYLETLDKILPKVNQILISGGADSSSIIINAGDGSIIPIR